MLIRCPWSFGVALGLVVVLTVTITTMAESGNLGSTVISTGLIVATAAALLWWGYSEKTTRNEERRLDQGIDDLVRQFKAQ